LLGRARALALPVEFLGHGGRPQGLAAGSSPLRGCWPPFAALLVVTTAALMSLWRYQSALGDVQERVAETRTRATAVRNALESSNAAVAELTRLQRVKLAQIPSIAIIDELTKLLPDGVWISDLRLEGTALDLYRPRQVRLRRCCRCSSARSCLRRRP
jgi:hypothetical protein